MERDPQIFFKKLSPFERRFEIQESERSE